MRTSQKRSHYFFFQFLNLSVDVSFRTRKSRCISESQITPDWSTIINTLESFCIFIIIFIIIYLIYAGYLHLYTRNKPRLQTIQCYSYSVVTIHGAYNDICNVKSIALLHQYFPQCVCCAQYGCFLQFFDFVLSWYVAQALLLLLLLLLVISFMQSICNYIPGTHHVPRVHSAAAIPQLQLAYGTGNVISRAEYFVPSQQ